MWLDLHKDSQITRIFAYTTFSNTPITMKIKAIIAAAAAFILMTGCDRSVKLFNGKDLDGWGFALADDSKTPEEVFYVEDGIIHITGQPFGYMYTQEKYSNFDLDVEWAWEGEGTNSGIFLLIEDLTAPFPNCIECNLKAGDAGVFVVLGGAALEEVKPDEAGGRFLRKNRLEESPSEKPDGEWNLTHIEVRDGHIKAYINGVLQNEGTDLNKEGRIGLQSEGGHVKFRSVVLDPK